MIEKLQMHNNYTLVKHMRWVHTPREMGVIVFSMWGPLYVRELLYTCCKSVVRESFLVIVALHVTTPSACWGSVVVVHVKCNNHSPFP